MFPATEIAPEIVTSAVLVDFPNLKPLVPLSAASVAGQVCAALNELPDGSKITFPVLRKVVVWFAKLKVPARMVRLPVSSAAAVAPPMMLAKVPELFPKARPCDPASMVMLPLPYTYAELIRTAFGVVDGELPVMVMSPPPVAAILWKLVRLPLQVLTPSESLLVELIADPVIEIAVPEAFAEVMVVGARLPPKISNAWQLLVPVQPSETASIVTAPVPESTVEPCHILTPIASATLALL